MSEIDRAAERIRAGGIVAFPTETVYGLGADATNAHAVRRVFELKGRPSHNPLIVHVSDEEMARSVAREWPDNAELLARACWPGPLTIVVPRAARVPDIVTAGGDTVALRCPAHDLAQALIETSSTPIVGPSANPSGSVSPTTAEHVRASFPNEADVLILEGGACARGIESTVVSVVDDPPVVLRLGAIERARIAEALELDSIAVARDAPGASLRSPGQLTRHYAPHATTRLFNADQWPDVLRDAEQPVVVITHDGSRDPAPQPVKFFLDMPNEPEAYAAHLYAALRRADELRPRTILIERPPIEQDPDAWEAVTDRLTRATAR